jgi:hypothetical protein
MSWASAGSVSGVAEEPGMSSGVFSIFPGAKMLTQQRSDRGQKARCMQLSLVSACFAEQLLFSNTSYVRYSGDLLI